MSKPLGLIRDLSAKYAIIKQKVNDSNQISSLHNESFSGSERGFIPQQYMNDNSNSNTNNNTNTTTVTPVVVETTPMPVVEQVATQRATIEEDGIVMNTPKMDPVPVTVGASDNVDSDLPF